MSGPQYLIAGVEVPEAAFRQFERVAAVAEAAKAFHERLVSTQDYYIAFDAPERNAMTKLGAALAAVEEGEQQ